MKDSSSADGKKILLKLLNNFEGYIATGVFAVITILLTIQVFSRYLLNYSFTWAEEIAELLFVVMIYCAIPAAVTKRKQIKIDALLMVMPFKMRRFMMYLNHIVFIAFCIYVTNPFMKVIRNLGKAKNPISGIPQALIYRIIPVMLALTVIRLIQDIIALSKEDESTLGKSQPTIDLDAYEKEWKEKCQQSQ